MNFSLTAELAFGADLARDAGHLGGEDPQLLDHRVDDRRRAQELALERPAVDVEADGLQEIPLGDGGDRAGDLAGRAQQVVDQGVDRRLHLAPGALAAAEADAVADLARLADQLADAFELGGHPVVGGDDGVEGVGDLAGEADAVAREAHGEVSVAHRLQGEQQLSRLQFTPCRLPWRIDGCPASSHHDSWRAFPAFGDPSGDTEASPTVEQGSRPGARPPPGAEARRRRYLFLGS